MHAETIADDRRESFGQFLIATRTRAGVTLQQVSIETKVPPRYLEALEQGRVDVLPAGIYRRAILQSYALSIGLDRDVALEWFDRTFGEDAAPPLRIEPRMDGASSRPTLTFAPSRGLTAAAACVLVALVTASAVLVREVRPEVAHRAVTADLPVRVAGRDERAAATNPAPAAPSSPTPSRPTRIAADRLVITSQPTGARVTVNGIGWGVTPLTVRHLPPGVKVVRVTKDGYLARQRSVQVGGDGPASVRLQLRPRHPNSIPPRS